MKNSRKSREELSDLFEDLSNREGDLYHIAHARKRNGDSPYDGESVITADKRMGTKFTRRYLSVVKKFKQSSFDRS